MTLVEQRAPIAPLVTERGVTIISPGVVEKIASRAASEVDGVAGVRSGVGRLVNRLLSRSSEDGAEVGTEADVRRGEAAVELTLSVRYPEPVGQVAARVRRHVKERVLALTGLEVTEVDITVPELVTAVAASPRVV